MTLANGDRLGPYEILGPIGAGGMGEVYRARDTRLDRFVAIKVIAPARLGNEQVRQRFEREARAIAALSHPSICTLHDVGSADGIEFLVMEHLEGETLAERLQRDGALGVDETLRVATELADALTAAHRAGVIHRDLKPGNIMLTRERGARHGVWHVKVLDFGLAKLRPQPLATGSQLTTATAPLTGEGTFIGTLAYMAPEQLEGRDVDARADLFAFGAVVYEMATGRPAFSGESQASLVAAILAKEPKPLSGVRGSAPVGLERLIRKCLAKHPDARWQSASDVADELRWIASGSGSGTGAATLPSKRRSVRLAVTAVGVVVFAAVVAAFWQWRSTRAVPKDVQHQQLTFTGDVPLAALSPDGRTIAYAIGRPEAGMQVMVSDARGGGTLPIWKGHSVSSLTWMPDGSHVAIAGQQMGEVFKVWIVPRLGGAAQVFAGGALIASSLDGSAFAMTFENVRGFKIQKVGDPATPFVQLTGFRWSHAIDWHARTNSVLLLSGNDDLGSSIWRVAPDGSNQTRLYSSKEPIHAICASPVADVVYAFRERGHSSDLLRVVISPEDVDRAAVLLTGVPVDAENRRCSVSSDGRRLIYGRATQYSNLWSLELKPGSEPRALTTGTQQWDMPAVSPDGQWIASATDETDSQIVRIPIGGGEAIRLGQGYAPKWSPDGKELAFVSRRSGSPRIWITSADGLMAREVPDSPVGSADLVWSPDGRLAWPTLDNRNYRIRDLKTGADEHLVKDSSRGWIFHARFSPRGDRVAFLRNQPKEGLRLWLISWPGREERRLDASLFPIGWSADGESIDGYSISGSPTVSRVAVRTGKPEVIARFPFGTTGECDVTPDRAAVICSVVEKKSDAWLMQNFDPDIR